MPLLFIHRTGYLADVGANTADAYLITLDNAESLEIDKTKMVIAGASAGGCLAAALAQRLKDDVGPAVMPMIGRYCVSTKNNFLASHIIHPDLNRGCTAHLGHESSLDIQESYVPARRKDLAGLPSAWIGVGSLDVFQDEDVEYARRLEEAGVDVHPEVVQGGFHGFHVFCPKSDVSRRF